MEHFTHTEQPLIQLEERYKEIDWSLKNINHNEQRRKDLRKEMACITLELWGKHNDGEVEFVRV